MGAGFVTVLLTSMGSEITYPLLGQLTGTLVLTVSEKFDNTALIWCKAIQMSKVSHGPSILLLPPCPLAPTWFPTIACSHTIAIIMVTVVDFSARSVSLGSNFRRTQKPHGRPLSQMRCGGSSVPFSSRSSS